MAPEWCSVVVVVASPAALFGIWFLVQTALYRSVSL